MRRHTKHGITESIEVFASGNDPGDITGLLAEIGRNLTREFERLGKVQPVFNIHIKDSIIQRSNLLSFCDLDGTCGGNVVIEDSVVQRSNIASWNEMQKKEVEEERLRKEKEEQEKDKQISTRQEFVRLDISDFPKVVTIIGVMAFTMFLVGYGITYIIEIGYYPIPPHIILFIFAIGFVLSSVFFEKRGAIYPWSLLGSIIASTCLVFIITTTVGGLKYIWEKGFTGLGTDLVFYAFTICIILSMILFNFARHKF